MCLPPLEEVATTTHHKRFGRPTLLPTRRQPVVEDDDEDRVTFQEHDEVHEIQTALSCLGEDPDRQELWYSRANILDFRRQAQLLSKKCRETPHYEQEECTRGLELRMSLQRQDRKQQIVKRILDAQDDDSNAEELAQIASHHSAWSRKLALATAHKDFYAAYHPNLTSVLPEMPALLDCSRDLTTKKRALVLGPSSTGVGRRVRCRMY